MISGSSTSDQTELSEIALPRERTRFSDAEISRRRESILEAAESQGCDLVIAYGADRSGSAVEWLCEWPVTREAMLLVDGSSGQDLLLMQFYNHVPQAKELAARCEVRWAGTTTGDTIVCITKSYVELAGESPVTVMTKQPCSWWAASGETLPSKPHDKVANLGGEQVYGPYDEESCVSVVSLPVETERTGAEPLFWRRRPWKVQRSWSYSTEGPVGVVGAERIHSSIRNVRDPSRHRHNGHRMPTCGAR